jgi:hypothetical protein
MFIGKETGERQKLSNDPKTDNMKYFGIFDNSKRLNTKEKREKTLKKVLSDEEQDK